MSYLQEAFREAARREFDMIPEEEEIEYSFSPKFLRKMRGLLRAEAYGYWKYVNTAAKRVAIAVAIIVMLLTSAMAIKPVRERVIKFFVEVYEEYFSITFGEKESGDLYAATEPMTRYTISWLPEGYIETKFVEKDVLYTTVWKNQEDIPILLNQTTGTQETTLDHVSDDMCEFDDSELSIRYLSMNGQGTYVWEQNGYIFQLLVPDGISMDTALQMIHSLAYTKNN